MTVRLSGFSSGLDIDSLVTSLMKTERIQRDKLEQKKYTIQYKREDFLKVNSQLSALQKNASKMKLTANVNKMTSVVTGDSNGISVFTSSTAAAGSYSVKVTQLATRASVTSNKFIDTSSTPFDPTNPLASQSSNFVGGMSSDGTDAVDFSFKINGVEISVDADNESMNSIITKINNSQAGVTAVFDSTTGKINFQSKTAGLVNGPDKNGNAITFEDITKSGGKGFVTDVLKIDTTDTNLTKPSQGAAIEVNGIAMQSNTNDFSVNGLKITAKVEGSSATIEIKRNVDEMINNIKDFIKSFNDTLTLVNTEYDETHKRNYNPLTQEQRKDMTENEAKLWDEEAKKGMLYRDGTLSKVRNDLKSATITEFTGTGSSTYKTLGSIGISSTGWRDNGVLTIDETKLREALENDPEAVVNMFTNSSTNPKDKGLAYRLYDTLTSAIKSIKDTAGFTSSGEDESILGKQLKSTNLRMADWDSILKSKESAYYARFSAMEKTIQKYQSQMSSLGIS